MSVCTDPLCPCDWDALLEDRRYPLKPKKEKVMPIDFDTPKPVNVSFYAYTDGLPPMKPDFFDEVSNLLGEAEELVAGDRQDDYGSPEESFERIAKLWSAYLGMEVNAVDVASLMALLKISRLSQAKGHRDSWLDLVSYAALGGALAEATTEKEASE